MSRQTLSDVELSEEFLESLLIEWETVRQDFKQTLDVSNAEHRWSLAKDLQAFANKHDPRVGCIVIGVTDQGREVVGCESLGWDEAKLRQSLSTVFDPRIEWELRSAMLRGKVVQVILIPQATLRPIQFKDSKSRENSRESFYWRKGEILIREGSITRLWNSTDTADVMRRSDPKPRLEVVWRLDDQEGDHIYVPFHSTTNEVSFQPATVAGESPDARQLFLGQLPELFEANNESHPDLERLRSLAAEKTTRLAALQRAINLSKQADARHASVTRGFGPPAREPNELDATIVLANTGRAMAGLLHLDLEAPKGLLFVPYWPSNFLVSGPIDFFVEEEGGAKVNLRRPSLLHSREVTACVRLRYEEVGDYEIAYSCAVENLEEPVEGVLRVTVHE